MDNRSEYHDVPASVLAAIDRWVQYRDYPGSFVTRLLCNDLVGTIRAADPQSLAALPAILRYVHNEVPTLAWGGVAKFTSWGSDTAATDTGHPLHVATSKTLESYLDAAHDVGEAKGSRGAE
tara:strand:+ start:2402 stop:2767 length:366 start_codon:yes stop_codon:yes gene_type:complete